MIIAHLADLHLGYRAYSRVTASGVNQREADVAAAFEEAIDRVADLAPDLVLVAGDVFHSVRPSNAAIALAFRRFARMAARLPGVPLVMVAGERDTPRSADTATILDLFREIPDLSVATRGVERIHLPALDTEVVAVPHEALAGGRVPDLRPRARSSARVLVAHATLSGAPGDRRLQPPLAEGGAALPAEALELESWDYVALGHHPVATEIASNAWYSGGIERTSNDIWAEAVSPKGFLTFDTVARAATFHPLHTRKVVDLPRVSARGLDPAEVSAAIAAALDGVPGGIAGRIVRLVVTDLSRPALRELDQGLLREARAQALHFLLEARPPERISPGATVAVRGVSLERQVEAFFGRAWVPTLEGIDRERLVDLARSYLREAGEGPGVGAV